MKNIFIALILTFPGLIVRWILHKGEVPIDELDHDEGKNMKVSLFIYSIIWIVYKVVK